ncbi:MAG TPA: hypothetical protein DEH78_23700 [Solibacterales bacterium]|nr:hypothetical protein [Bryobacterales bacterium]
MKALWLLFPLPLLAQPCACPSPAALEANAQGMEAHARRSLTEASAAYTKAIAAAPPRVPTEDEQALIRAAAPRLFTQAGEAFPLKDAVAILHPSAPWIAYHLFWDDDIDFPDDNDPCDHEVFWVRLDDARRKPVELVTYYHGRLLGSSDATRAFVQWGKHGTLPGDWHSMEAVRLDMRRTYDRLSTRGRDYPGSPLAEGWPLKFAGAWEDFIRFDRELPAPRWRTAVSCLNNAVLNRRFLRYNFAAKTEWPPQLCAEQP